MVERGFFIGLHGSLMTQLGIETIAHNISNQSTVGYRTQRPTFGDMFYRSDRLPTSSTNPIQSGHGIDLQSIDTLFNQGNFQSTGTFSDIAIEGEGFFVLKDPRQPAALQKIYTRAGTFTFDAGIASPGGSGSPSSLRVTSSGDVIGFAEPPEFKVLPKLVDRSSSNIVQGVVANEDGVIESAMTTLEDIEINPTDKARSTTAYTSAGSLDSVAVEYISSLLTDETVSQLDSISGEYKGNIDRGVLTVTWAANGSGRWEFIRAGQTEPLPNDSANFSAGTITADSINDTLIEGISLRTTKEPMAAGKIRYLVGTNEIESNSAPIVNVQGAYAGNRKDGTLTIETLATGAFTWTFTPSGGEYVSERGTGTLTAGAENTSIPGLTITAASTLSAGTLVLDTRSQAQATSFTTRLYDEATPDTPHTMVTTFKKISQNNWGYTVAGFSEEMFSQADSTISIIEGGKRMLTTYANIDPNEIDVTIFNKEMTLASSTLETDTGSNFLYARGGYWTTPQSGTISMTINAGGTGSWSFVPVGFVDPSATGTFTGLVPNTTYSAAAENELIPGMVFRTGSAISAGTATLNTTYGDYNVSDNNIVFSPQLSSRLSESTRVTVDYKFDSSVFTDNFGFQTFDEFGNVSSVTTNNGSIDFSVVPPVKTGTLDFKIKANSNAEELILTPDFSRNTQQFGAGELFTLGADGNVRGTLEQMEFNERGILIGTFTNENQRPLAMLGIAQFQNPGGLSRVGDTAFQETVASGAASFEPASTSGGGRATVRGYNLEMSNVNLEDELTELIFLQRAFQFNGRSIKLMDDIVTNAIQLKR